MRDSLPAIPDTALPRDVRAGSAEDKRAYKAALGFEQVLLGHLVKEMTASTPSLTSWMPKPCTSATRRTSRRVHSSPAATSTRGARVCAAAP